MLEYTVIWCFKLAVFFGTGALHLNPDTEQWLHKESAEFLYHGQTIVEAGIWVVWQVREIVDSKLGWCVFFITFSITKLSIIQKGDFMKKIRDILLWVGSLGIWTIPVLLFLGSKFDIPTHYFGIYVFIVFGTMFLWKIIDMSIDDWSTCLIAWAHTLTWTSAIPHFLLLQCLFCFPSCTGYNPMVGMTVSVAVAVEESCK